MNRRIVRIARSFLLTAGLLLPAGWVAAATTTRPDVSYPDKKEDWYVVKIGDAKCGYMHSFSDRAGDEVHTRLRMHFEIARGEARVEIAGEQNYRETLDGRPLGFAFEIRLGAIPVKYLGRITNGKVHLTTEQAGAKREATYDFDPEVKFAWGQVLEQRKRGLRKGLRFTLKTYEPSIRIDKPIEMEVLVHGKEKVDVLGKSEELYRVTSTMKLKAPSIAGDDADAGAGGDADVKAAADAATLDIATESWVDEDATPVISTLDMGIVEVRFYRATRDDALAEGDAPEMFINTFITMDRRVPTSARSVTYRLKLPAGAKQRLPDLPDTSMQTFKRVGDREGLLTVRRIDWDKLRSAAGDSHASEAMKTYMQSSTMVDLEDRRIRRLARRAVRSAKSPAQKADALRKFVTDYVSDKNLDVGFATASEVARNRTGDCTEHGVLLAALARAAGLPSRGVSGIVQVPEGPLGAGGLRAFGYHMWTQVYIAGKWVDIDAAMRQTDCDPTHIALALMPLGDEGMLDSMMSMFPLLGRLKLEIVDIEE